MQLAFAVIELVLAAVFIVFAWQAYATYAGHAGQFNALSCVTDLSSCIGLTAGIVVELFVLVILMFVIALVAVRAPAKAY